MGARTRATEPELRSAWEAGETTRAAAARLHISKDTVSKVWRALYGNDAVANRGKEMVSAACSKVGRSGTGKKKVYGATEKPCSVCGEPITMTTFQVARSKAALVCDLCREGTPCPVCGSKVRGVGGMSGHFRHRRDAGDVEHIKYAQGQKDARWAGKEEPDDYVTCRECGLQATNLTGHIKVHAIDAGTYRLRYGDGARLRSLSTSRDIQEVFREKYPEGFTYTPKVIKCPECESTREVRATTAMSRLDPRCGLCRAAEKMMLREVRWEGKSEPADFVTCRACGNFRGENLAPHIKSKHPELVGQYTVVYGGAPVLADPVLRLREREKVSICRSDLMPFMDERGRVEVSRAAKHFGCAHYTVLLRCRRYGFPVRNLLAFQKWVLDLVAEGLGGTGYVWEWSSSDITNPRTGYKFRFDGYFATHNLLVEAHGSHHFKFNAYWHKTEAAFEERREVDALKVQRAQELGYKVLVVQYDEPFTDPAYLAGRLVQMGVLKPGGYQGKPPEPADGGDVFDLFG